MRLVLYFKKTLVILNLQFQMQLINLKKMINLKHLVQNNKIDQNLAFDILSKFKQITTDNYDLQIQTLYILIKVTGIKLSEQLVSESVKIGFQQIKIKPDIEDFFNIVNQSNIIEKQITKQLGKEELYSAGQIYCSILKNIPGSLSSLYSSIKTHRQLKLSTLRFLHQYQQEDKTINILCQLIKDNQDSGLAAFVIGSATEINQINNPIEIAQYVLNQVNGKDKTISTICGDILGGFFKQNYKLLEQLLFDNIKSNSQALRYSCIQSLKYTHQWTNKTQILLEMLQHEKDISILTGIIKALTQNLQYIKLNNLTQYLTFCLRRYEEKELNFGNFVEKRDDAKDLRSLTFDLLELLLEKQNLELKSILIEVFDKFAEDKYDKTRIPRLRIIEKITKRDPFELTPFYEILLKTFETILKTLQRQLQKQDQSFDQEQKKIKLILSILQEQILKSFNQ